MRIAPAHHRRSMRLHNVDYSATGAYFVTLCAFQRECLFGEIVAGEMRLNAAGEIVRGEWLKTAKIRPNVILDEFVVMPNHFHAIIVINDAPSVGAYCNTPLPTHATNSENLLRSPSQTIGAIVRGFKSAATNQINRWRNTPGLPVWQRNYYERVVRNDRELAAIRQYIADNPARWETDENHPDIPLHA